MLQTNPPGIEPSRKAVATVSGVPVRADPRGYDWKRHQPYERHQREHTSIGS